MEFPQLVVQVVVVTEFQRASIHLDNVTVALADWQATARGPRTPLAVIQIKISRHSKQLQRAADEQSCCWPSSPSI